MSNPHFSHQANHQRHIAQHKHSVHTAQQAHARFQESARRNADQASRMAQHQFDAARATNERLRAMHANSARPANGFFVTLVKIVVFFGWLAYMAWLIFAA